MLGLPSEFWTKHVLKEIGDASGRFIYIDPGSLGARDKRVAWILVELGFSSGFPEHIDLEWGNFFTDNT